MDYTPVCAMISKALETECRKHFFKRFQSFIKQQSDPDLLPDGQKEALGFSGRDFTLGSVAFILPCSNRAPFGQDYLRLLARYARESLFSDDCGIDLSRDEQVLDTLKEYCDDIE